MGCPNCNRENVITLSICPSCGAMVNDSVREELATKITPLKKLAIRDLKSKKETKGKSSMPKPSNKIELKPSPKSILTMPTATSEIVSKKTNPTLLEFQHRHSRVPEWRLQIQNAVQNRYKTKSPAGERVSAGNSFAGRGAAAAAVGAVALKPEKQKLETEPQTENIHLQNALKRIELSRRKYHIVRDQPAKHKKKEISREKKSVSYAHAKQNDIPKNFKRFEASPVSAPPKPQTVIEEPVKEKFLYDTSELYPELIPAEVSTSFGRAKTKSYKKATEIRKSRANGQKVLETKPAENVLEEETEIAEVFEEAEVIEDLAPYALRFNSGIFDLIIGSFASLILLSPFILVGGNWFTTAGAFAFLATTAIVMFIYLTTSIGLYGKTFGMHLFSIEMIDIEGEEYPSFHQAAVSSAVYLLSLAFCGIGFLSSFIDEEHRAVHDLVSGTVVVKEL